MMLTDASLVRPNRLTLLALVALISLGGLLAVPARGQQDFTAVQITAHPVAGVVSWLEGRGGNIGVSAGPDGVLIVDSQYEPLAERIRAALDALDGDGDGKPRYVINTHWHGDHVGGNAVFGRDGTLIAHAAVRHRMATTREHRGRPVEPAAPEALPVITYPQTLSLHFNGEEIRVRHLPAGHTDGDSMVWFTGSHVVHLGDQFFAGRFPFVDLDSGGSVRGLLHSVARLLEELPPDIRIIPGHGPLSTTDDLRTYHRMLAESIASVSEQLAAGADTAAIVAHGLPAEWNAWNWSFITRDAWLTTVAASLTREAQATPAGEGAQPDGDASAPPPGSAETTPPAPR